MTQTIPTPVPPEDFILRAYRSSIPRPNGSPNLILTQAGDRFTLTVDGKLIDILHDSELSYGGNGRPWNFQRLEIIAGNTILTIPTLAIDTDSGKFDDDRYGIYEQIGGKPKFSFRCHSLSMVGGRKTQFLFRIDIYRKNVSQGGDRPNYETEIGHMQVGDSKAGDQPWSRLGDILRGTYDPSHWGRLPYQKIDNTDAGPFLQSDSPFEQNRVVEIKQVPLGTSNRSTLELNYRSSTQVSRYQVNGINLPVDGQGIQLTQRPSDQWVAGSVGPEWQIDVRSPFYALWNSAVERYRNALQTTRPVNRLTFIPIFAKTSELDLLIRCSVDVNSPGPTVTAGQLKITVNSAYPELPSGGLVPAQVVFDPVVPIGSPYSCLLSKLPPGRDVSAGSLGFQLSFAPSPNVPTLIDLSQNEPARVGSLDLTFGGKIQKSLISDSEFALLDLSGETSRVPRLGATVYLPVVKIDPAGQDGLPSSEYVPENYEVVSKQSPAYCNETAMEQEFRGRPPLVISPYNDGTSEAQAYYLAKIVESNPQIYAQTVSIEIRDLHDTASDDAGSPLGPKQKVIVLDADPFLVAEVRFDGFRRRPKKTGASDVVAIWNMNRVDGAAWELQTMAEPFDLVLPPQGIGEEMPKSDELQEKDRPDPNGNLSPLDYRLSPPAINKLDSSYTPQNFTEAPWNLRRILGYPGQRDAGAGVEKLQFELLYGLSCIAKTPALRLAEIFATLGRIPGRLQKDPEPAVNAANYAQYRKKWASLFGLYSKRVAVFAPRFSGANYGKTIGVKGASSTPEVVTLEEAVNCQFRSSSSLYYRAESEVPLAGQPPVNQDQFTVDPRGLKGGATWGFESPRIYHATVRNPLSSSAKIVNPYFSALGGSGFEKVSFDNDLTSVYSNTQIGRTFFYSVERMGRIAVYHNLARHVIEYERSVAPGPQFAATQTAFCGRPVLRKMREFVQILEPKAFLSSGKTAFPECGCAKALEFKSEIIPVDSSWGSNVGDTGWKIPLWRRAPAGNTQPAAGTSPQSKAQVATSKGKAEKTTSPGRTNLTGCILPPYIYNKPEIVFDMAGFDGADVECAIIDPEKLFFYTETKNPDPNPQTWKLVEALDFSLAPMPAQNPGFSSSTVSELAASDLPVPSGLSLFTLHLDPGHGAVNLVEGRTDQALGAVLQSVTFQRQPNSAAKTDLQTKIDALTNGIRGDLFTAIRNGVAQVNNVATKPADIANLIATQVNSLQENLSNHVQTQAQQLKDQIGAPTGWIQGNLKTWQDSISAQTREFQNNLTAQWRQLDNALAQANADNFKKALQTIVDNEIDSLFIQIKSVPASVDPLTRLCATVDRALASADSTISDAFKSFRTAVKDGQQAAQGQFAGFNSTVNSSLDQLRVAVQSGIEPWMPGAGLMVRVWEAPLDQALGNIDGFLTGSFASISDELDKVYPPKLTSSPLQAFRQKLKDFVDADQIVPVQLEGLHGDVRKKADELISNFQVPSDVSQLPAAIVGLGKQIDQALQDQITPGLKALSSTISENENKVVKFLSNLAVDASGELTAALGALAKSVPADTSQKLENLRKQAELALGGYVDTLLSNLPKQMGLASLPNGNTVSTVLQRAFGSAPRVPNLDFSLPNVGYFYLPDLKNVNVTPLLTQVSGLGAALSPLGSALPSVAMLDRMLPSDLLKNFNLSDVLPNFAGLKLDSLFSGLKMPDGADKYIKVTHGLDQSSRRAWVQADMDFTTDTLATLFTIGPLALQLPKATFKCQVKLQADATGQIVKQATGSISGDWTLVISGTRLITMVSTSLTFDEMGHVHFNVSPDRVVLADALKFIEQIIASYSAPGSGFTILPSAKGIQTHLNLPIPNTSGGTTGITNLSFGFGFGLQFDPFAITASFNLARKEAPFNLAVFILGGSGYVETDLVFIPGQSLTCSVTIELAASASFSVAFGPISGYVAVLLGMSVNFHSGSGTDLRVGIFIQVLGEVSILSIISAYVGLRLEATYVNGTFTGRGQFSISIKICWCFTLEVNEHVEFTLGSGGGNQMALNEPLYFPGLNDTISDVPMAAARFKKPPNYLEIATRYINMIS